MTFLMTATPISMHVMEKMSLSKTGYCNSVSCCSSMFLPSLVTGYLIKKIGHSNVIYIGVLLFLQSYFVL